MMRRVTITRKREILKPAAYYYVYCDNNLVISVSNGKSASFEIDEGTHSLYFTIQTRYGGTVRSNVLALPSGEKPINLIAYRNVRVFHLEFSEDPPIKS